MFIIATAVAVPTSTPVIINIPVSAPSRTPIPPIEIGSNANIATALRIGAKYISSILSPKLRTR